MVDWLRLSSWLVHSRSHSSHPHRSGATFRASSISLTTGSSSGFGSVHSLLLRLMVSILLFRCSSLITSLDLSIMELAKGSRSQLRISLRWAFIPPLPPITGLVGGGVPLLLVQFLWSLNKSHNGQASRLLLIMLSRHLFSCLLFFPTLNIFSIMLTAPFRIFWLLLLSSTPTCSSSLICTMPAFM